LLRAAPGGPRSEKNKRHEIDACGDAQAGGDKDIAHRGDAQADAADKIRVNSVHPGFVDTPMTKPGHSNPEIAQKRLEATPLGRFGTPADIAAGCLYLASDEAAWVTGSELVIDGGMTAN
jgi:NAD(P)-dependent dehydrogenase (short-subunit alcohol dehydrogenase family)